MELIENLRQKLRLINESAFQGLHFDHRPIQQEIKKLESLVNKPHSSPPLDRIQAAMGRFLATFTLENFQDIRLVSYGAATPLGVYQIRLIEKKDHFPKLLDLVEGYRDRPRALRRLYRGLLASYFSYDPEAQYAKDSGPEHWKRLRRFLNDHLDDLRAEGFNPNWISVLQKHRNLLTDNPCSRYGEALLNGLSDDFKEAEQCLGFSGTSWVARAVVNARIGAAIHRPDHEFKAHLPELLKLLSDRRHAPLLNASLAKLLERYSKTEPIVVHQELCNFAVEHWKNPWLPINQNRWALVSESTRNMVARWLKRELMKSFFELLSADGSNDTRRLDFWVKYEDQISIYFALGKHAMKNPEPSFQILRQKMDGILMELHGGGSKENNAFIMVLGTHTFVEFGMPGHAVYIYSSQKLPFRLQGSSEISLSNLKDTEYCIDRWQHRDNVHGYNRWEQRFYAYLYENFSIRVSNSQEIPEPWRSGSYYKTGNETNYRSFCQAFNLDIEDARSLGGYFWIRANDQTSIINQQLRAWGFTYRPGKGWFFGD